MQTLRPEACTEGPPVLWVTTADDSLDAWPLATEAQAGPNLSFPEALAIAAATPGPDIIRFDPRVFPVDDPTTITLRANVDHHFGLVENTCIDALGSGVVLDWAVAQADACPSCLFSLGPGARIVGFKLVRLPAPLLVDGATVDGMWLEARFGALTTSWVSRVSSTVISAAETGIRAVSGFSTVESNFFGFDPTGRTALPLGTALVASRAVLFSGNVVRLTLGGIQVDMPPAVGVFQAERNLLGVDVLGVPLPGNEPGEGFTLAGGDHWVAGQNVISEASTGIHVTETNASVLIFSNSIYGNGRAIVYDGVPPLPAPTITSVHPLQGIQGTCEVAGNVEVYEDRGDQGRYPQRRLACTPGQPWSYQGLLTTGSNVTALLFSFMNPRGSSVFSAPVRVPAP